MRKIFSLIAISGVLAMTTLGVDLVGSDVSYKTATLTDTNAVRETFIAGRTLNSSPYMISVWNACKSGNGTADSGTVKVEGILANPDGSVRTNTFCTYTISSGTLTNSLIPIDISKIVMKGETVKVSFSTATNATYTIGFMTYGWRKD
jgi:hypothetical protein